MRIFLGIFCLVCVTVVSLLWCRGVKSTKPPIYVFPDMDFQSKYKSHSFNDFFADKRNARPIVPGSVMRDSALNLASVFDENYTYAIDQNKPLYTGKTAEGAFFQGFPFPVTNEVLTLGQEKFRIYCSVCHGLAGDGNGVTKQYGMVATVSYHDDRLREMPEGEIFNTITYGKNTMLGYADKLAPEERWAVVAYVRALQLSALSSIDAVPAKHRSDLGL
jgi:hypothetical protein